MTAGCVGSMTPVCVMRMVPVQCGADIILSDYINMEDTMPNGNAELHLRLYQFGSGNLILSTEDISRQKA